MPERTAVAMSPRERFIQMAQEEMLKFETQERELRKKDRFDRAAQLKIPLHDEFH